MPHATPAARKPRGRGDAAVDVVGSRAGRRSGDGDTRRVGRRRGRTARRRGAAAPSRTARSGGTAGSSTQSVAIFSGTHRCGTIEKFWRTKNRASCVNAHSVSKPAASRARAQLVDEPRGEADAAEIVRRRRATALRRPSLDSGASSAHALMLAADVADDEPVGVPAQLVELARQQVALALMRADQRVQRLRVVGSAGRNTKSVTLGSLDAPFDVDFRRPRRSRAHDVVQNRQRLVDVALA